MDSSPPRKRPSGWDNDFLQGLDKHGISLERLAHIPPGNRVVPRRRPVSFKEATLKFKGSGLSKGRILELNDENILREKPADDAAARNTMKWPCTPRSRPLAKQVDTYSINRGAIISDERLVSWSSINQLAMSNGLSVLIYRIENEVVNVLEDMYAAALCYSPTGKFLAVSRRSSTLPELDVWYVESENVTLVQRKVIKDVGVIKCLEWDATEKKIIGGTSMGVTIVFDARELIILHKRHRHESPIVKVRLTSTMSYLGTNYATGAIVIYEWPSMEELLCIETEYKMGVLFDWHPWTGEDFVFVEPNRRSILLYNVPHKMVTGYYKYNTSSFKIDSLSFNKVTGELLVGYYAECCTLNVYEIVVLSALNHVVDIIRTTNGFIKFLDWSPDGERFVATSNFIVDELTIWSFRNHVPLKSAVTSSPTKPLIENI